MLLSGYFASLTETQKYSNVNDSSIVGIVFFSWLVLLWLIGTSSCIIFGYVCSKLTLYENTIDNNSDKTSKYLKNSLPMDLINIISSYSGSIVFSNSTFYVELKQNRGILHVLPSNVPLSIEVKTIKKRHNSWKCEFTMSYNDKKLKNISFRLPRKQIHHKITRITFNGDAAKWLTVAYIRFNKQKHLNEFWYKVSNNEYLFEDTLLSELFEKAIYNAPYSY